MSRSVNKIILVGNVGRDPEVRETQNGNKVATYARVLTMRRSAKRLNWCAGPAMNSTRMIF